MSTELRSCGSESADAGGDAESWSLLKSLAESGGVEVESSGTLFIATRTDAASRSWTCWCFEMRSFDVRDHSGVCSHLPIQESQHKSGQSITEDDSTRYGDGGERGGLPHQVGMGSSKCVLKRGGSLRRMGTNKCLVKQLLCLYPLPHFSQRSSGRFFLPSLTRGWPSLALLMRAF